MVAIVVQTTSVNLNEKHLAQLCLAVAMAGLAGLISKDEAWDLMDILYANHVRLSKDILNGEE